MSPQQINLLDPRFRRQTPHFSARTLAHALGAVLALAVLFQQLYAWQNRSLEATLAQMDQRTADLRDQTVRFAKEFTAQGRSAVLADEIVRVEEQLRLRRGLIAGMQAGAGSHAGGFSPYLTALARQTLQGVWLTAVDIGERGELVLKGRVLETDLVPLYIRSLRNEPPFAGRSVHELRLSAREPAKAGASRPAAARSVEFSLSIPLKERGAKESS